MRHDLPYQLLLQGCQKAIYCLHKFFDFVPKGSVEACFHFVPLQAGILFQHLLQKVARTFAVLNNILAQTISPPQYAAFRHKNYHA